MKRFMFFKFYLQIAFSKEVIENKINFKRYIVFGFNKRYLKPEPRLSFQYFLINIFGLFFAYIEPSE